MKRRLGRQCGSMSALPLFFALVMACGDGTAVVVEVTARPEVIGARALAVTVQNDGDSTEKRFNITGEFPTTFSVTASGRTGDLSIRVFAENEQGIPCGVGSTILPLENGETAEGTIELDPADFVVNTRTTAVQKSAFENGRNGRQIAAASDGSFAVTFLDDCSQTGICYVYARLFDELGQPRVNDANGDDTEMIVNLEDVDSETSGIAIGASSMFLAWASFTPDVRGVGLSLTGEHAAANETIVSGSMGGPKDADVAALASDEFAVTWSQLGGGGGTDIRARFVAGDGTPRTNPTTGDAAEFAVSTSAGVGFDNPTVTSTGQGREMVVAWEGADDVFVKTFDAAGASTSPGADVALTANAATATVSGPRAVSLGGGNVAVVWAIQDSSDASLDRGAIQLGIFSMPSGNPVGALATVSPAILGSPPAGDPPELPAPALAVAEDGSIIVAWTDCKIDDGDRGESDRCGKNDLDSCDVLLRTYDASLVPSEVIQVNTTTECSQRDPSIEAINGGAVVTFTDASQAQPDPSGSAVRARLVFFTP